MKKLPFGGRGRSRRLLVIPLVFVLIAVMGISFVSCTGNTGTVTPGETGSDSTPGGSGPDSTPGGNDPGADVAKITIADKGASEYKLVIGEVADFAENAVDQLEKKFAKSGINIAVADDGGTPAKKIIVETSADYLDPEGGVLSFEGYRVYVDGDKNVRIVGGDLESTSAALEYFGSLFKDGSLEIAENFDYGFHPFKKIKGLKINGVSIKEFKIVADENDTLAANAAKYVKKLIFTYAGVYVDGNDSAAHTITFVYGDDDSTGRLEVKDGNVIVTGSKKIGFYRVFRDLLPETDAEANLEEGFKVAIDYGDFITYEDFGAVGDGKTDDSKAIANAHSDQKDSGRAVLAKEDATYYFGKSAKSSKITADVDWSTAHFIIDDSELKGAGSNIFSIPSTSKTKSIKSGLTSVSAGQTNIGVTLETKSMVTITNDGVKQYIRKGANQDSGSSQKEIILVDENGNVDPSTPILWDFKKITSASAMPINDPELTVKGGIFTTIANQAASNYTYYNRGIEIQRSNAVITGVAHYITGEGETGAPYNGFLMISNTYGTVVRDTVLTGHMTYYTMGSGKSITPMGSYDCQVTNTIGLSFEHVIQSNDITNMLYWGSYASNYSRNISFEGCILGRFDAHKGVCNVTLKNCSFGHQGINLIGHGTATIENCKIYAKTMINLRDDYGSTWDGDIVIKNCTYYPYFGMINADAAIIGGTNTFDHNFGYTCYLPKNITIDGLYVNDSMPLAGTAPMLFADINPNYNSDSYKGKYPMVMTEKVTVKGFESYSGKNLEVSANKFMYKDVTIQFVD